MSRPPVRQRLLPFTGLIPVLLMVPVLAFNLYAIAIMLGIASGALVIAYHLRRGQGVTSLDVLLLGFAGANAVLCFGFDNAVLVDHIDAVIYTLLAAMAAASLLTDTPWTTQFTRRVVSPAVWDRPEFLAVNRASTALWAVGFAVCDAMALALGQPLRLYLPIATMVALAVVSRPLSRAHLARLLGVSAGALPPEWTEMTQTTSVLGG
jgi:hypothetical protein